MNLRLLLLYSIFHSPKMCWDIQMFLTFLSLMPDDALQVDAGPRLAGPQTGRIPLQCSWEGSILGVGAYGPCPHRQLLGVRSRQGRRGERWDWRQGRSRGPRVTWSRGSWHCEHGVHLQGIRWDLIKKHAYVYIYINLSFEVYISRNWRRRDGKNILKTIFFLCSLNITDLSLSLIWLFECVDGRSF